MGSLGLVYGFARDQGGVGFACDNWWGWHSGNDLGRGWKMKNGG